MNVRILAPPWILLLISIVMGMDIPDELDPFLELLFETSECESVVGNEAFLVVETRKCKPFTCNFPFEVCMRPSNLLNEEKANQCREIPDACLTAANGGIPVLRPTISTSTLIPTPPSTRIGTETSLIDNHGVDIDGDFEEAGIDGNFETTHRPAPRSRIIRPNRVQQVAICDQGIPNGRFCGFQLKYTFNKATGNCEQFWFPGCRTEDTNDNLFDSLENCQAVTRSCIARPAFGRVEVSTYPTRSLPEPTLAPIVQPQPQPFNGNRGPDPSQFKGIMEWAGSALGGNGNSGILTRPGEYGGGELGTGAGVTQPPNLIRFIANTITDVSSAQKSGNANAGGAALFTNLLQQFG